MDRNVKLLSFTSFLNDMSSEMIFPILPFFLSSLGANPALIGFAGGLIEGISGLMKVFSGYVSDLLGKRKFFVLFGYSISQISKLGLSLSKTAFSAVAFLFFERSGKGIRTAPRDALIAESAVKKGKAFGFHRAMDSFGAVLGALLAAYLFEIWCNERQIILVASLIGIVSVFPLIALKDKTNSRKPELNMRIKKYVLCSALFGSANISYVFFLLRFGGNVFDALKMYALFSFVYALLSYPAGYISDKVGKRVVASSGYLFMFFSCILAYFTNLALITLGIFMALTDATQRSFAAEIAESYGFGIGAYQLVFGISALVANTAYGWMWNFNENLAFFTAALLSIASAAVFLLV